MANGFTRMKDGSWGLRIDSHVPQDGETVTVETKDGTRKQVKVGKVLWTGENRFGPGTVALCTIEPREATQDRPAPSPVAPIRRPAPAPEVAPGNPKRDDDLPF